ncbi:SAFB-like transcription modulator isoform X2 [Gouania willdenowi]|nr:SAFB-like transcription modulator isoform X2 [Gouania willdenowi]
MMMDQWAELSKSQNDDDADLELAKKLQEEEYQAAFNQEPEQEQGAAAAPQAVEDGGGDSGHIPIQPEASVKRDPDEELKVEEILTHSDDETNDEFLAEPSKNGAQDPSIKAEPEDKKKDSIKKASSTTGASGQAKSSSRDRDGKADKVHRGAVSSSNSHSSLDILAKNDPLKKSHSKTEKEDKSIDKHRSAGIRKGNKAPPTDKEEKKLSESGKEKKDSFSSNYGQDSTKEDKRKHGRGKSPSKPMFDKRHFRRGQGFDKVEMMKDKQRHSTAREDGRDFLHLKKRKAQDRRKREKEQRVREEQEYLLQERQRLEREKQKLERARLERESLERERIRIKRKRTEEAERMTLELKKLQEQQEQYRFDQQKRNNLKRGREEEHGWRDKGHSNGNKKMRSESEVRVNPGSSYNQQQNRFSSFISGTRPRYPESLVVQANTNDRRNRFDGEPEAEESVPAPHRDTSGFNREPRNFETTRRTEPPSSGHRSKRKR